MDDFVKICSINDIPHDSPLCVEIDGRPVAICKVGEKFYAIEDICPHQGSSFDGGSLDEDLLTCPLHGWRMNVISGESMEAPGVTIETYEVQIREDDVYVRI